MQQQKFKRNAERTKRNEVELETAAQKRNTNNNGWLLRTSKHRSYMPKWTNTRQTNGSRACQTEMSFFKRILFGRTNSFMAVASNFNQCALVPAAHRTISLTKTYCYFPKFSPRNQLPSVNFAESFNCARTFFIAFELFIFHNCSMRALW